MGVGARRAADSCHGPRHSPGISSLLCCLLTPSRSKSHSKLPPTLSPILVFPFVLAPVTNSLAFVHFISSVHFSRTTFLQLISLRFHSLFCFIAVFFRHLTSLTVGRSTLHSVPPPVGSVLQNVSQSDICPRGHMLTVPGPSLLLAQTSRGNRPRGETLPTLCFHPSSHTICSRLMSCHGVDEQAATTAANFICHM